MHTTKTIFFYTCGFAYNTAVKLDEKDFRRKYFNYIFKKI